MHLVRQQTVAKILETAPHLDLDGVFACWFQLVPALAELGECVEGSLCLSNK